MSYIERMSAPALLTAEELLRLNLPNIWLWRFSRWMTDQVKYSRSLAIG